MDILHGVFWILGGVITFTVCYILASGSAEDKFFPNTLKSILFYGFAGIGCVALIGCVIFGVVSITIGEGAHSHMFGLREYGFGTVTVVEDNGKWLYVNGGESYHTLIIPYVSKSIRYKEFLKDGEIYLEPYILTGDSRDGIPLTITVEARYKPENPNGSYYYNPNDMLSYVRSYGWEWDYDYIHRTYDGRIMEMLNTHDAESLVRNGFWIQDEPLQYNRNYRVWLGAEYDYVDPWKEEELQEKISREISSPYQGMVSYWNDQLDNNY